MLDVSSARITDAGIRQNNLKMPEALNMIEKAPQKFPGSWGELRGWEVKNFQNIADFDGPATDSHYLPQAGSLSLFVGL